jgi:uncharacterized membrane protein YhaH (DUF805 family)
MDYVWFLFKFEGRINRAKFWLAALIIFCWTIFLALLFLPIAKLFGGIHPISFKYETGDLSRIIDPASVRIVIDSFRRGDPVSTSMLIPIIYRVIVTPIAAWCSAATSIKRLHDRNRSGWWTIPFLVVPPLYSQFEGRLGASLATSLFAVMVSTLWIWGFVELFILKGTTGPNRFGSDPLATVSPDASVARAKTSINELLQD